MHRRLGMSRACGAAKAARTASESWRRSWTHTKSHTALIREDWDRTPGAAIEIDLTDHLP